MIIIIGGGGGTPKPKAHTDRLLEYISDKGKEGLKKVRKFFGRFIWMFP